MTGIRGMMLDKGIGKEIYTLMLVVALVLITVPGVLQPAYAQQTRWYAGYAYYAYDQYFGCGAYTQTYIP